MIPYTLPYYCQADAEILKAALLKGELQGKQFYTEEASKKLAAKLDIVDTDQVLLTTSCTHALELAAELCHFCHEDEVLVPSYTFVTSASAFIGKGVKVVFVDVESPKSPYPSLAEYKKRITNRTKALVVVNYGGIHPHINSIKSFCVENSLILIEDAAQSIGAEINGKKYGTFGDLSTISFHETKNISCGEGGALIINNKRFLRRAEVLYDKGTNRKAFLNGEVDKYTWIDLGASYLMSGLNAALLSSQLDKLEQINTKRTEIWNFYLKYFTNKQDSIDLVIPKVYDNILSNSHIFYLIINGDLVSFKEALIKSNIQVTSHYVCLHNSPFSVAKGLDIPCDNASFVEARLLRFPIHMNIDLGELENRLDYAFKLL